MYIYISYNFCNFTFVASVASLNSPSSTDEKYEPLSISAVCKRSSNIMAQIIYFNNNMKLLMLVFSYGSTWSPLL